MPRDKLARANLGLSATSHEVGLRLGLSVLVIGGGGVN